MNRFKSFGRPLVLIAVLLIGTVGAWAQDEKGNIYIRVTDTQGTSLPGVTLEITGQGAPRPLASLG